MTSTATNSSKNTTMRMPTIAPVLRPEPPATASEGQGQGGTRAKTGRKKRRRRGVRGEERVQHEGEGIERKLEREREMMRNAGRAFNSRHQVSQPQVCRSYSGKFTRETSENEHIENMLKTIPSIRAT